MIQKPSLLVEAAKSPVTRRHFLRRAGLASSVAAFAPAAAAYLAGKPEATAAPLDNIDAAVLNFALQTEYLGASYYCYAASGAGFVANGGEVDGVGTQGTFTVKANPMVPFSNPLIQQLANEFAVDELGHAAFVRAGLASNGYPVYAAPDVDLLDSFNTIATKAGLGDSFDPYASDANFLIGAYILEDTDVSAFAGAATLFTSAGFLAAASGILSDEAYHLGAVRTNLFIMSQEKGSTKKYGINIEKTMHQLTAYKNKVSDGTTTPSGAQILGATSTESIIMDGSANITAADSNSVAFERNPREVLNLLYGAKGATKGGFYPSGLNGFPGFV